MVTGLLGQSQVLTQKLLTLLTNLHLKFANMPHSVLKLNQAPC